MQETVTAGASESRFRLLITAQDLTRRRPAHEPGRIARALRKAVIDLNPHQVDAAVSALGSLRRRGLVLADEVGLGKTIEAGLVLAQLAAENRKHLLVLSPASLRMQWERELDEWTHFQHAADGNAVSRDRRVGPPERLRWIADPKYSRHHDEVLALSAMVTGGGRLFSIVDEAPRATFP